MAKPASRPQSDAPGALLFVYGSLLKATGLPEVDAALAGARSLGRGFIHARLYSLGGYPGAKPVPAARARASKVWGRLLRLRAPEALQALDRYEGCDARFPQRGEFVRVEAPVTLCSGRVRRAQVYFYNQALRGKRPIPSGDYLDFLRGTAVRGDEAGTIREAV